MRLSGWATALAVAGALLAAGSAQAQRVPSSKVPSTRDPGVRGDITVPYLTNTGTALGVYQGVAPRIYASPIVDDPTNPGARPVYNLPFYGAVNAFGDRSDGAVQRAGMFPLLPRQPR